MDHFIDPKAKIVFEDSYWDSEMIISTVGRISNSIKIDSKDKCSVIIYLERSAVLLCSMLAVMSSGYTYVLCNDEIPDKRLNFIIEDTCAQVVITDTKNVNKFHGLKVVNVDNLNELCDCMEKQVSINEIAYILYTSGSTGKPKGVCVTYKGLENFIKGMSEVIDFTVGDKIACLSSSLFDIFFLESIFALHMGLTVILSSKKENKNVRLLNKLLIKYQPDIVQATPSKFSLITSDKYGYKVLDSVKTLLIGGEALPIPLLKSVKEKLGCLIYNMYGPTETTIWSTVRNLTNEKMVTVGKPIRNTRIYILDSERNELKYGQIGEICIGGDGVAARYNNMATLTEQKFINYKGDRVFCTGDSGYINSNEELICLGRMDNQIKLYGNRIELEEIEEVIMLYPEIVRAVVFVDDHCTDYEHLVGAYTGKYEIEESELRNFIGQHLPDYMVPKVYKKICEIPLNINGKTDRVLLKKEIMDGYGY